MGERFRGRVKNAGVLAATVLLATGCRNDWATPTGPNGGAVDMNKLSSELPSLGDLASKLPQDPTTLSRLGITLQRTDSDLTWTQTLTKNAVQGVYSVTVQFPQGNNRKTQSDFEANTGVTVEFLTKSVSQQKPSGDGGIISDERRSLIETKIGGVTVYTLKTQNSGDYGVGGQFKEEKPETVTANGSGDPMGAADLDGYDASAQAIITSFPTTS